MTRVLPAVLLSIAFTCNSATAQLLTGWVNLDDKVVVSPIGELPVNAAGLEFISPGGFLVPVPGGPAAPADPFTFFLANSPNQITAGNLGTSVTFDKPTVMSAGYDFDAAAANGTSPCEDISMSWGGGSEPSFHWALSGDANVDGKVSFEDFSILSSNFGEVGVWPDGDFDCDRMVGFSDFLLLSSNFGREQDLTPPRIPPFVIPFNDVAAVPEPNGNSMIWLGLLGAFIAIRSWAPRSDIQTGKFC